MAQLLLARELDQCTFRPALLDAPPALAHRIAAARAAAAAAAAPPAAPPAAQGGGDAAAGARRRAPPPPGEAGWNPSVTVQRAALGGGLTAVGPLPPPPP
jgi:hypothetical protein